MTPTAGGKSANQQPLVLGYHIYLDVVSILFFPYYKLHTVAEAPAVFLQPIHAF
jgi:hypothetical protein